MGEYIYRMTQGNYRGVMSLVSSASDIARESGKSKVDMQDFLDAAENTYGDNENS